MLELHIPYGEGAQILKIDEAAVRGVLAPGAVQSDGQPSEEALIRQALATPIGSAPLSELAWHKKRAVVILSDHTRPVPSRLLLPPLLAELRRGNPEIDVTLLVATGCHRGTTRAELAAKLGEDILAAENIVVHDCDDRDRMINLGTLPSGAPLLVNRLAVEADLLVAEGFIEPHFFAGFSGGRKSVLPGLCQRETVLGNHCSAFISHPASRTGCLRDNPIHRDMVAGAAMAGLAFILNVVVDDRQRVIAAFAGDTVQAHEAGCRMAGRHGRVRPAPAEIVITSNGGYPLDQNIYQCVKGLTAAAASALPGAVLIICGACRDGAGGDDFYRVLSETGDLPALMQKIQATPMADTRPDQWQYQILCRILLEHEVIMVTEPDNQRLVEAMHMRYAPDLPRALQMAYAQKGKQAGLTVIPNGVSVIVGDDSEEI